MEVRQPFFGEEIEGEGDTRRRRDAFAALAQLFDVDIRIGVRRRREQLAREPQDTLGLVCNHQLIDERLEIREHVDFGQQFVRWSSHAQKYEGSPASPGAPERHNRPAPHGSRHSSHVGNSVQTRQAPPHEYGRTSVNASVPPVSDEVSAR